MYQLVSKSQLPHRRPHCKRRVGRHHLSSAALVEAAATLAAVAGLAADVASVVDAPVDVLHRGGAGAPEGAVVLVGAVDGLAASAESSVDAGAPELRVGWGRFC